MNRGSLFRKWDLHVHTPESFHHEYCFSDRVEADKYGGDIWSKYIDALEAIDDISVLGVTDYYSVEGYKKVLEYRGQGRLQNFDLILPNIEFRLDKVIEGKYLNYHVIFSDEVAVRDIEKEFLELIEIRAEGGEVRRLKRCNVEAIGQSLRAQHKPFKSQSDYYIGCMNIKVNLDHIEKLLQGTETLFGGKYLQVLPDEGWSSISWDGQGHLDKKNLLIGCHALFASNPQTQMWALGLDDLSEEAFVGEFRSLKPCIHGSDAHCFDRLCKPDHDRFCWIKADCTFEGLKQILYEPKDRVRIQRDNPEPRKSIYTVKEVEVRNSAINDELAIEECSLPLHSDLVAVIGGKGTGKTALLDLLANCFEDRCTRSAVDKNSFVQRIESEKPDLTVGIGFRGKEVENFSKELRQDKFFHDTKITYLPQGKIEEYSGNRKTLNKKIQEIVFNNVNVVKAAHRERFERIRSQIHILAGEIQDMNGEIHRLEWDTRREISDELVNNRSAAEGSLKDRRDALDNLRRRLHKTDADAIDLLKGEETNLRLSHDKLASLRTQLESLREDIVGFAAKWDSILPDLNKELANLSQPVSITPVNFQVQLTEIDSALSAVSAAIEEVHSKVEQKQEELLRLSGVQKQQAELLAAIQALDEQKAGFDEQLRVIRDKKNRIERLKEERLTKYMDLVHKHVEWRDCYRDAINAFSEGKTEIMSGIDFASSIRFQCEQFLLVGTDLLDQRSVTRLQMEQCAKEAEKAVGEEEWQAVKERVDKFIKKTVGKRRHIKPTRANQEFYNWLFANYYTLETTVFYKGTPMHKLSMGEKGTVLLKLLLAEGEYPLIVDQPEENLDNKFIYAELVGAFRQAKAQRQVIIATHNANLVVNTDAEQVIVAEFEDNKISYRHGPLENRSIRKEITSILEGGDTAFKKRERRYDIREVTV